MTEGATHQITLFGEEVEAKRVTCEAYDDAVCSTPAEYEVETLVYDGVGQTYEEIPVCELCAVDFTEPEHPDESRKASRLDVLGRWRYGE